MAASLASVLFAGSTLKRTTPGRGPARINADKEHIETEQKQKKSNILYSSLSFLPLGQALRGFYLLALLASCRDLPLAAAQQVGYIMSKLVEQVFFLPYAGTPKDGIIFVHFRGRTRPHKLCF